MENIKSNSDSFVILSRSYKKVYTVSTLKLLSGVGGTSLRPSEAIQ